MLLECCSSQAPFSGQSQERHMYGCICLIYTYVYIFISLSIYIENHKFIPIPSIPTYQHRVLSSFPFFFFLYLCLPSPTMRNLVAIFNMFTYLLSPLCKANPLTKPKQTRLLPHHCTLLLLPGLCLLRNKESWEEVRRKIGRDKFFLKAFEKEILTSFSVTFYIITRKISAQNIKIDI